MRREKHLFGGMPRLTLGLLATLVLALWLCPATGFAEEPVDVGPGGEPVMVAQDEGPALETQVVTHAHDGVEFKAWDDDDRLPDAGNYYLTKDVTLGSSWVLNGNIILCLNGKKITYNGSDKKAVWVVQGKLDLYDEASDQGSIASGVNNVIYISTNATFNMHGGTITGNNADSNRSGVSIAGGAFIMSGGTITESGGVYAHEESTFNMSGGTITGNSAKKGGGVYLEHDTTFNMSGGTITGNSAEEGGGVYLVSEEGDGVNLAATFIMSGGTITKNSATNGGGVYVSGGINHTLYSFPAAIMAISGVASVSGNTDADGTHASNVFVGQGENGNERSHYPAYDAKITVAGALSDGASFGVTMPKPVGTFTAGFKEKTDGADPATYFASDDDTYAVTADGNGEGMLAVVYPVTVAEGIEHGTVEVNKAKAAEGASIKITAKADDDYELDTVTVKAADGTQIETKDGSFTMPAKAVTVSATFTRRAEPQPKPEPEPEPQPTPAEVPPVSVTAHVQRRGTLAAVSGGKVAGTTGRSLRMESIRLTVPGASASGGIEYRGHVQHKGWEKSFVRDGKLSGTEGRSRRLEAVQVRLWGDMAGKYDVWYRVHSQRYGWMAWAKNGESAGTQGMSRRGEAIQVVLVAKGGPAPAKAFQGATQTYAKAFVRK